MQLIVQMKTFCCVFCWPAFQTALRVAARRGVIGRSSSEGAASCSIREASSVTESSSSRSILWRVTGRDARTRSSAWRVSSSAGWIEEAFPEAVEPSSRVAFDERVGRARAWVASAYRDLPLEEPRERPPPADEAARLLDEAVRRDAEEIVHGDPEAALWIERVGFLAAHVPELALPSYSHAELGDVLAPLAASRTTLQQIRDGGVAAAVRATLPWETQQIVENEAPTTLEVPSGARIKLRYDGDNPPVLAVRVQELFGMRSSPRVARGRVPVLLHILGPNFRPGAGHAGPGELLGDDVLAGTEGPPRPLPEARVARGSADGPGRAIAAAAWSLIYVRSALPAHTPHTPDPAGF